ncbi:MAG: hypothetical protein HOW73_07665 [Polyangiaceae bacterium]|nr:hypothetical protein [Polyangiaceae bacterium]
MKIDGEDIRNVVDHAQGAGRTVEPLLRGTSNVLGEVGRRLVHPMSRKARLVEFKEAEYQNAEDWTAAEDGAVTVNAGVSGGTTIDLPEPIEFIHFGHVYRDRSPLFPNPKLDDTATVLVAPPDAPQPGVEVPAHGLMYRAALQREGILLGGFIRAQMDALIAEEKSKGVIGVLAQVIADLTGSAGGTGDKPNAVDLNPHLKKVIAAEKKINRPTVDYPVLHDAGIELHTARKAYREYLVAELEKRHAPAKSPGGGILNDQVDEVNEMRQAAHDWLGKKDAPHDAIPKLTRLVPSSVQDFLSVIQKISFKAWDICAALNYEYAVRLEPIVEDACRRITAHSIKTRAVPVFPVWYLEPQPEYHLDPNVEQKIFDKIDNPFGVASGLKGLITGKLNEWVDVVTDPVKGALQDFDQQVGIDKTLDFLSRPDRYTPGRPFLDDIFLIPQDPDPPDVPDAARRARVGWSGGLGQMAVEALKGALNIKHLPEFLEWIIAKVSTVCAEFIRAVYCRLLTMKDTDQVTEAEMHEAAKRHLVGNVIETILGGLKFVDGLRKITLDIPIAEVAISTDALIGRAKEFAALNLEKFIAPVVKFAMRDLHGMIFAYRQTAISNNALTMEVHLAQLPTVFSRLFRNVFFPLWDKVIERAMEAVTASLAPRVLEAGKALLKAREQVEQVRGKIVQGLAALDSLPAQLPGVGFDLMHPKDSINKIKSDWNPIIKNAKDAWNNAELDVTQDLPGTEGDALEQAFPVQQRVKAIEASAVTPKHLELVLPLLKWKEPEPKALPGAEDAAGGAGASNAVDNTAPSAGQLPALSSPSYHSGNTPNGGPLPSFPLGDYPMGDYPMASGNAMYASNEFGSGPASYSGYGPQGALANHQSALDYGAPFADHQTSDLPAQAFYAQQSQEPSAEMTQDLGDLSHLAELEDVEQTVDIDHAQLSALPPFLGPNKKA